MPVHSPELLEDLTVWIKGVEQTQFFIFQIHPGGGQEVQEDDSEKLPHDRRNFFWGGC